MFFFVFYRHHLPHIHVQYAEYRCSIDFNGNLLSGNIPNKQRKLVEAWIEIRKEELNALWHILQNGNNGFTNNKSIAINKPYKPVVSATACPNNIVEVMSPFAPGLRPTAAAA